MTITVLRGDCRDVLPTLPAQSAHTCITSPPYFKLRSYLPEDHPDKDREIGQEATPDCLGWATKTRCGACFVCVMVDVFRHVRRVLRDDATLWLNLGDSYAGSWGAQSRQHAGKQADNPSVISAFQIRAARRNASGTGSIPPGSGLKPKDLIGIPWRVALALQADGWFLRQDIIWQKLNPLPESVRDRCTKAHEYLFLLSKSPRYYFDSSEMQEPGSGALAGNIGHGKYEPGTKEHRTKMGLADWANRQKARRRADSTYESHVPGSSNHSGIHRAGQLREPETRNKRSVWPIATEPFSGTHFATFPSALIDPAVRAGCPPGGTVLDPFGGSGTTGVVADRHGRDAVLIDLSGENVAMARDRIRADAPLFAEVADAH